MRECVIYTVAMSLICLQMLLRPIARFCIRRSLHIQDLVEAAKYAFVQEGERELRSRGEEPNVSKLAAMTGLHRRDVMRLHRDDDVVSHPRGLVSRILGAWLDNENFSLKPGVPAELTLSGSERNFNSLVASVTKDLHPGTILSELERIGAVSRFGDRIVLQRYTHIIKADEQSALRHAAADVTDLLESVEVNIRGEEPTLHATTHYDNVPAERAVELRNWLLRQGGRIHQEARAYLSQFDRDVHTQANDNGGRVRVAFGTFGIVERYEESSK